VARDLLSRRREGAVLVIIAVPGTPQTGQGRGLAVLFLLPAGRALRALPLIDLTLNELMGLRAWRSFSAYAARAWLCRSE
jgi:hypothetical protein